MKNLDRFQFRAWDIDSENMEYDVSFDFVRSNDITFDGDGTLREGYYDLMQCTGVTDKNGRLIYEGDIVYIDMPDCKVRFMFYGMFQVVSYKGCFGVRDYKHDYEHGNNFYCFSSSRIDLEEENFEILGNIYENPELLLKN